MNTNRHTELKIYGFNACLELWRKRPQDVIRVYIEKELLKQTGPLLKWCSANKKAYHIIPREEMDRVADSVHHEGICFLTREPEQKGVDQLLAWLRSQQKSCLLYLDGVENPHNVGSIVRACAHFGVLYILGDKKTLPKQSPSMCRIAQGGMEHVGLIPIENPAKTLKTLQNDGFRTIVTSSHEGSSLYKFAFPAKTLLIMGAEGAGVSQATLALAQDKIQIPGSGAVESLNVAIATSLCLGEYWRQRNQ